MNFFEKAIKGFKQPQNTHIVPDTALASAVVTPSGKRTTKRNKTRISKSKMCICEL